MTKIPDTKWRPLPMFQRGWKEGRPLGVILHFTAGCGDVWAGLRDRGLSVHVGVRRDGSVEQFVDLDDVAFHARDASFLYYGIETVANPPRPQDEGRGLVLCDITEAQLRQVARVAAFMLDVAENKSGKDIPTERAPGFAFTRGIKCHADGLEKPEVWNVKIHWDCPVRAGDDDIVQWIDPGMRTALERSPWGWDEMLSEIRRHRGEAPAARGMEPSAEGEHREGTFMGIEFANEEEFGVALRRQLVGRWADADQAALAGAKVGDPLMTPGDLRHSFLLLRGLYEKGREALGTDDPDVIGRELASRLFGRR